MKTAFKCDDLSTGKAPKLFIKRRSRRRKRRSFLNFHSIKQIASDACLLQLDSVLSMPKGGAIINSRCFVIGADQCYLKL